MGTARGAARAQMGSRVGGVRAVKRHWERGAVCAAPGPYRSPQQGGCGAGGCGLMIKETWALLQPWVWWETQQQIVVGPQPARC